jgi:hypothetical protein
LCRERSGCQNEDYGGKNLLDIHVVVFYHGTNIDSGLFCYQTKAAEPGSLAAERVFYGLRYTVYGTR